MKRLKNTLLFILCTMLLSSISVRGQTPVSVNDSMFVGFMRSDGVFVIYDAQGSVSIKDGKFAEKLETTHLKLSKFLAVTDFYQTLDEARAKLGLPPVTKPPSISSQHYFLNDSKDWQKYCPVWVSEVYILPEALKPCEDCIAYHHPTHSVSNVVNQFSQCDLLVRGVKSGKVYAKTIHKTPVTSFQFANNHPVNRYLNPTLAHDCVLYLPQSEPIEFVWTNKTDVKIEASLIFTDPATGVNQFQFVECVGLGTYRYTHYPDRFSSLPSWNQVIKSNLNSYSQCN